LEKGNHKFVFQYVPFFDYLVGANTQYFIDVMIVDERIEQTIKARKIASQTGKKNKRFTREKNNLKRSCQNSYPKPSFVSNVNFFIPFPKNQTNTLNNQQNILTDKTFFPRNVY